MGINGCPRNKISQQAAPWTLGEVRICCAMGEGATIRIKCSAWKTVFSTRCHTLLKQLLSALELQLMVLQVIVYYVLLFYKYHVVMSGWNSVQACDNVSFQWACALSSSVCICLFGVFMCVIWLSWVGVVYLCVISYRGWLGWLSCVLVVCQ